MAWTHRGRGPDSCRDSAPGPALGNNEADNRVDDGEPGLESQNCGLERRNLEGLLGKALEAKPIWTGLCESVRDAFFAPKAPPLELTSIPVAAPDRMAARTNPWAFGTSAAVNGGILALLLCLGLRTAGTPAK